MKVLVHYYDFLWDNYQGGQGKIVQSNYVVDVSENVSIGNLRFEIERELRRHVAGIRFFHQHNEEPKIIKIEILNNT